MSLLFMRQTKIPSGGRVVIYSTIMGSVMSILLFLRTLGLEYHVFTLIWY